MRLILRRTSFTEYGVFGALWNEQGDLLAYTLEHAYPNENVPAYLPKMPAGTYDCQRGMHTLKSSTWAFETFEVLGVPGHSGILFHTGNENDDSAGCVLIGKEIVGSRLLNSREAFKEFMRKMEGIDEFQLEVKPRTAPQC